MKIVFIVPAVGISGGLNVIVQQAQQAARAGHKVYIASDYHNFDVYSSFLLGDFISFETCSWAEAEKQTWDVAIATWWTTIFMLPRFLAEKHILLLQAWESQFYQLGDPAQDAFLEALRMPDLSFIVIAHWLGEALVNLIGIDRKRIATVLNGLSSHFLVAGQDDQVRIPVLIEGNILDARKNVLESAELCTKLNIPFSIVTSSSAPIPRNIKPLHVYRGIPYAEMPSIYRRHDILFKLSNSEGMFGPPLEMFASGGTAVVWDCQGHEEYMHHLSNSMISPINDFNQAVKNLKILLENPKKTSELKEAAFETASNWTTWPESSADFLIKLEKLPSSIQFSAFCEFLRTRDLALGTGIVNNPVEQSSRYTTVTVFSKGKRIVKATLMQFPILFKIIAPIYSLAMRILRRFRWI